MARFTILGPVGAVIGDERVRLPPKERIVLATLLLRAGKVVPGETLARALWDTAPPASARNTVQGHVKRLRRLPGTESGRIATAAPGYLIEVGPDELDLSRFTELRSRADAPIRAGSWESAGRLLREAWLGATLADLGQGEDARQSWAQALHLAECTRDARAVELRLLAESEPQPAA